MNRKPIELSKLVVIPICCKSDVIQFLNDGIEKLDSVSPKEYADTYIQLKCDFFFKFQKDNRIEIVKDKDGEDIEIRHADNYRRAFITSTRFGIDFFHEVRELILSNTLIRSEKNQKLGENDEYLNIWLKNLY